MTEDFIRYALTDVQVVDVVAGVLIAGKAVVVEDGKISAIVDEAKLEPGLRQISLGGRYLSPGLIDCHAHCFV